MVVPLTQAVGLGFVISPPWGSRTVADGMPKSKNDLSSVSPRLSPRGAEPPPLLTREARFDGVKPEIPERLIGGRVTRIVENEQNVIFLMGAVIGQNLTVVMPRRVHK